MKPTIYDVANEAGVSIATVSKIINNTGKIGTDTKKKVLKVMEEMEYQPSFIASALTGKRTNTIGLMVPDIANPLFGEVARYIEDEAQKHGLGVIMSSTDSQDEDFEDYFSLLLRKQVDGLIIASTIHNKHKDVLQMVKQKIPVVLLTTDFPSLTIPTVKVDDYQGGYLAAEHLLDLGHRRLGIISEKARSSKLRLDGATDAMEYFQVSLQDDYLHRVQGSIENGRQTADKLFSMKKPPTAIFAFNDLLAIGILQKAEQYKLRVPEDLAVVGFDNTILSQICTPPLTTLAQPLSEMAHATVDLLMNQMNKESTISQRVMLTPALIQRDSTVKSP